MNDQLVYYVRFNFDGMALLRNIASVSSESTAASRRKVRGGRRKMRLRDTVIRHGHPAITTVHGKISAPS